MKTYNSVQPHVKRNFLIKQLIEKGITVNQDGVSIYELDYELLKEELVLQAFREIDAENGSNSWF